MAKEQNFVSRTFGEKNKFTSSSAGDVAIRVVVVDTQVPTSTADISFPPLESELNATFGSASAQPEGFTRYVNSGSSDVGFMQVVAQNDQWFYFSGSAI